MMDHLNDEVSQTELEEWLQTTDVFEQDFERSRSSQGATSSPPYRPKRSDFKRKSSFDDVRSDERMFGIDVQTALRAAQQDRMELASSGDVHVSNINNYSASCSSSSSLKSKSQSSNSHQAVIDLTATEPAIIDLTTNTLCQPPTTCATASPAMLYDDQDRNDRLGSYKRARMSFDSSTNIEESHNMLSLVDQTSSSFVATVGATGHNLMDRTKSCPTTRRSSVEFINNWQKLSHQDPRRTSLPESMAINKCQTLSHQDPRRTSLSESMPPASSQDSSSPTSFFRSMDEQSSRFHRMIGSGSEAPHYGDATISCDSTTLSNRSNYDELQDAISQTQQSRRMILGALSGSTRRDSNNDIASSAHHVPATAVQLPEFGIQCGLIGMAGPPPHPHSLPPSSTATRTTDEVTAAEAEAKRNLESIAREQMVLEKRLAEIRSMMNKH
mmetsp:Transcript_5548/g.8128  ORF Transcript_5548/g.8128 Transcript_5548/m.8128 type:complete len:442 (+) Transcript_5548:233-1558(+)